MRKRNKILLAFTLVARLLASLPFLPKRRKKEKGENERKKKWISFGK
ncbi:MAG: hypothetical protein WCX23_02065 [Candidatus Paceibacterota bacterium]|jgi:hypothetical protein|nr:hypothetical protein [Candidatus Paceibacterota bacterium]